MVTTETRAARVKQTAEVFTPPKLVNEMLDKLPVKMWEENKTFLDPACGNGEFLIWALIRKLQAGHKLLDALKTIYGVELMPDNVLECRVRLLKIISYFQPKITSDYINIICNNIVCHDALTYDFEFDKQPTQQELDEFTQKLPVMLTQVKVPLSKSSKTKTISLIDGKFYIKFEYQDFAVLRALRRLEFQYDVANRTWLVLNTQSNIEPLKKLAHTYNFRIEQVSALI
jgi:hypothetical protein